MKQKLYILTFLILTCTIVKADYSRLRLYQVIELTDIAFVGKITNVGTECYTVEIENLLYGNYSAKTISIVKFANWQDHYRFKEYGVNQREIIFTKKSNNTGHPFEYISIGAGNEGEIEIINDTALILDRINRESKYPLKDFCNAIVDYHNNLTLIDNFFKKELEKYFEPFDEQTLDTSKFSNDYINEFEKKSLIHKLLITDKQVHYRNIPWSESKSGCKDLDFETDIFRELFKDFENRIKIDVLGYNIDSVDILSKECETIRKGDEFFILPKSGKKTNLYFVYRYNNYIDTIRHFDFFIEKYRKPTIDTDIFKTLKKSKDYPWGHLGVTYGKYVDWSNFYEILSFNLDITSKNKTITLQSVSSRITYEMMNNIRNSNVKDEFRVYNIKAFDEQGHIINIDPVTFKIIE